MSVTEPKTPPTAKPKRRILSKTARQPAAAVSSDGDRARADGDSPSRAKLFQNGRSQAVRLPKAFRFEGNEVQIERRGQSVVLTPVQDALKAEQQQWDEYFQMLAELRDLEPIPGGRNQGVLAPKNIFHEGKR